MTSHANVRQIVFPAAGQRVPGGDGGRQRGTRADHPQLALFGGRPLAARGGGDAGVAASGGAPDGEIVLESTPNGAGGLFYEEWQRAEETGYTRHFFPWW